MQEMMELSEKMANLPPLPALRYVQVVSEPILGRIFYEASPAQFGADVEANEVRRRLQMQLCRKKMSLFAGRWPNGDRSRK